jgi:PleD family two-component response regulator
MASQMRKKSVSSISLSKLSQFSKKHKLSDDKEQEVNKSDHNISPRNKPWILVANDDRFLLEMIVGILEDDFQVEVAENGLQAFELVKKHGRAHYKAIVLDINMPIMDGVDACNLIHSYLSQECLISSMQIDPKRNSTEESKEPKEQNSTSVFV